MSTPKVPNIFYMNKPWEEQKDKIKDAKAAERSAEKMIKIKEEQDKLKTEKPGTQTEGSGRAAARKSLSGRVDSEKYLEKEDEFKKNVKDKIDETNKKMEERVADLKNSVEEKGGTGPVEYLFPGVKEAGTAVVEGVKDIKEKEEKRVKNENKPVEKTVDSLPKAPAADIEESKELLQKKYGVTNTGNDDIDQQNADAAKEQLVYDLGLYQIDKNGNKVPVEYKESTGRTMSRIGTALTMLLHIATGGVFPIIDCKAIFDDMNKDETTKRMTYEAIRDAAAEGEASKQKVAKQAEVDSETAKQAGRTAYYTSGKLESDLQSLQNQIALMREGNANQKDLQAYAQQLSLKAPMELESLLESSDMTQEDYQKLFRLIGGQTAVDTFLQRLGTGVGLASAGAAALKIFGKK